MHMRRKKQQMQNCAGLLIQIIKIFQVIPELTATLATRIVIPVRIPTGAAVVASLAAVTLEAAPAEEEAAAGRIFAAQKW